MKHKAQANRTNESAESDEQTEECQKGKQKQTLLPFAC